MKCNIKTLLLVVLIATIVSGCNTIKSQKSDQAIVKDTNPINSTQNINNDKNSEPLAQEEDYKKVFSNAKLETIRAELKDGRPWAQLAISDKGEIFGYAPAINNKLCDMFIYNINSKQIDIFHSIKDKLMPVFLEFNDNYIVWTECIDQENNRASRLVLLDRKTKEVTVIKEYPDKAPQIPDEYIALGKDYVLWSSGELDNNLVKYKIYKYDIASKMTSVFKEDAVTPAISSNFIAWLGSQNDKAKNSSVYIYNLNDNTTKKITEGKNPMYIQACEDSMVYSGLDDLKYLETNDKSAGNNNFSIFSYTNGNTSVISKSTADMFEFPQISKNFVGWRGTDKLRVYYKKVNKIAILTDKYANYSDVKVSNNYILWNSPAISNADEASKQAKEAGMYLSDLHILKVSEEK